MNAAKNSKKRSIGVAFGLGLVALALLSVSGCGGGSASDADALKVSGTNAKAGTVPTPAQTQALLKKGAALNTAELARAAEEAAAAAASESATASNKAGTKSGTQSNIKAGTKATASASLVTVYRFFNSQTKAHFYTASETEKATVLATLPQFSLDGAAFYASSAPATGLSPVYRFYNSQTGVHFYTISEDERAMVLSSLPQFQPEAVAYYASKVAGPQLTPLHRFYYTSKGFHFYTNSETERANIVATLPQYSPEGIGYHVMTADWGKSTLKLPHSGVTDQQCYQTGSDALVACSSAGATALNPQQDGHRTAVNPMSYSEVPNPAGGNYARTECVRDNVTGLVWEGKEANGSGLRAGNIFYTNYDDSTQLQRWNGSALVNPTQGEIDAASNSIGYKNYVNSIALCGFTDWRLPTVDELDGIVDASIANPGPTIHTAWFPNTSSYAYWTSSPYVGGAAAAWYVLFGSNGFDSYGRYDDGAVRLVRASQ